MPKYQKYNGRLKLWHETKSVRLYAIAESGIGIFSIKWTLSYYIVIVIAISSLWSAFSR